MRRQRLQALLDEHDLAAAVLCSYETLHAFAGANLDAQLHLPDRLELLVTVRGGAQFLLVCNIDESQVRDQLPDAEVHAYVEFEDDPAERLAALLRERGIERGRVGIEGRRLPASALRTLADALPEAELVSVDALLDPLLSVKTAAEVESLARCARLLLAAVDETAAAAATLSERGCAAGILTRVLSAGATPMFCFFAAGPNTALAHPEPGERPLPSGALWRVDVAARVPGGLIGDVARTGVVGEADAAQAEIFAGLRAAQDAVVAAVEPGRPARELYEVCRRAFADARLPFVMPHVGHGIGFGLHEAPLLEPRNDARLEPGTVLDVEPFTIVADRREGYHTEDVVLVTDDGARRLTEPQAELLRIPARP